MVLSDEAFTRNIKELEKIEPGKLFSEPEYQWSKTLRGDTYNPFIKILKEQKTEPKDSQHVSKTNEKFIAHMYNAIKLSPKETI